MLGTDLVQMLRGKYDVLECDLHNCNILDFNQIEDFVSSYRPNVIIHTAAYTNVDQAETDKEAALRLNETGTKYVATAAKQCHARLIHISTDYVFDGTKTSPYTEEDIPHPLGVYGTTKLRGEQQVQQIFGDHQPGRSGHHGGRKQMLGRDAHVNIGGQHTAGHRGEAADHNCIELGDRHAADVGPDHQRGFRLAHKNIRRGGEGLGLVE